jgi:hypothetical protein
MVQAYEEALVRLGVSVAKERRAFDAMVLMHQSAPTLKPADNRNCLPSNPRPLLVPSGKLDYALAFDP